MKKWWRKRRNGVLGAIAKPLISAVMRTVNLQVLHLERFTDEPRSVILCGLHANGLAACYTFRNQGIWTLVSLSRDGDLQNRIYTRFGFRTVRGSTGRGGARATIEAIRLLRATKERMIVAIDGPRGPRGIVQLGALVMAKKSGAALVPVGMSAKPRWQVNTWDLFMAPKPFSKLAVFVGEPILIPAEADDAALESLRLQLEEAILACESAADAQVGYQAKPGEKRVCD